MKISLGPNLYYWPREALLSFYREAARLPVDIVYLGEVVCARRHELKFEDWLAIGEALVAAGKEVVLSALALTESEGDLKNVRRIATNGRFRVEANDWGAVRLLSGTEGWVAGPHLNVYNPETLALLHELGARRWVAPFEATKETIAGVLSHRPQDLCAEIFAHGRIPLAHSARCFTARRFNLQKETCEYRCLEFPDGMILESRENQRFLSINGVQTTSAAVYSLLGEMQALRDVGIDMVRISPQSLGTTELLHEWRRALYGETSSRPSDIVNGFWHGSAGMVAV